MSELDRRLSFDDQWMFEIEEIVDTSIEFPDSLPFVDQTSFLTLQTEWTQAQYSRILSALMTGADLMYPYETQQIIYDFLKIVPSMITNCDDVADCIETSAAVASAMIAKLMANGFTPSPNAAIASDVPLMSQEQLDQNLLAADYDCSESQHNMSIARAIVRELHETFLDFLDEIELTTNAIEAANIATDGTPIFGTLNNITELADWFIETVAETYQAAYDQQSEDVIACAIFCVLESECSLSLDALIDVYEGIGGEVPPDKTDLQELIDFIITVTLAADETGVAVAHCLMLWTIRFAQSAFGVTWNTLQNTIRSAAIASDFSYELCDDCPPSETATTYWKMVFDFAISPYQFLATSVNTAFMNGGWQSISGTHSDSSVGIPDLGASYVVKAAAILAQIRDPESGGSNDFWALNGYTGVNWTGTQNQSYGNGTGYVAFSNEDYRGAINNSIVNSVRSINFIRRTSGTPVYPTRFTKIYKVAIWGIPNAGVKPAGSVWAGNSLPATLPELFT